MTLRQRQPRVQDRAFLAFVRTRRCIGCDGPPPTQAAHLRSACLGRDKRATGIGEKPDDRWSVSLCAQCHLDGPRALHKVGEAKFFAIRGLDPFYSAATLYAEFTVRRARERAARKPRLIKTRKRNANKKPQKKRAVSREITKRKHPWPKRAFPAGRKLGDRR